MRKPAYGKSAYGKPARRIGFGGRLARVLWRRSPRPGLRAALVLLAAACLGDACLGDASAARAGTTGSRDLCRDVTFAGVDHLVCEIAPARYRDDLRIDLHWQDENGAPFGSLGAVERALARRGRTVLITMNAGMYEPDLSPVGLFIAGGKVLAPVNVRSGSGNFYMKPNGVFLIATRKGGAAPAIVDTQAFLRSKPRPLIATQSGPLLVAKGRTHRRFEADGASRKIRNGIGVRADGTIVLALSRAGVSFGRFAHLFRDVLHCPDALYLDGSVSQLSRDGAAGQGLAVESLPGFGRPLGPILSVSAQPAKS